MGVRASASSTAPIGEETFRIETSAGPKRWTGPPLAKAPPLCAAGSGKHDQKPERVSHASIRVVDCTVDEADWDRVSAGAAVVGQFQP